MRARTPHATSSWNAPSPNSTCRHPHRSLRAPGATLARIDAALPLATAETVYRYLQDEGADDAELADLRAPFYADDHEP
ncbi:MAG: hypothetical protein ACLTMP_03535 [Eggerthella lenta]